MGSGERLLLSQGQPTGRGQETAGDTRMERIAWNSLGPPRRKSSALKSLCSVVLGFTLLAATLALVLSWLLATGVLDPHSSDRSLGARKLDISQPRNRLGATTGGTKVGQTTETPSSTLGLSSSSEAVVIADTRDAFTGLVTGITQPRGKPWVRKPPSVRKPTVRKTPTESGLMSVLTGRSETEIDREAETVTEMETVTERASESDAEVDEAGDTREEAENHFLEETETGELEAVSLELPGADTDTVVVSSRGTTDSTPGPVLAETTEVWTLRPGWDREQVEEAVKIVTEEQMSTNEKPVADTSSNSSSAPGSPPVETDS